MARKPLIPRTESVRQYRQFITEHGRTPRQTAEDPHERRLGVFAKDFRQADPARLSREDADARAEMILLHNRYTTRRHRRRRIPDVPGSAYAVEVSTFYDAYGRLPSPGEPGDREVFLAWTKLRRYATSPDAEALFAPLADIPGLMEEPGLPIERCLKELRDWHTSNGRLPSSNGDQPEERRLAWRWRDLSQRYDELSPSGRAVVDHLSRIYQNQKYSPSGLTPARRVAAFYSAHGRLPHYAAPDERLLYGRLRTLRSLNRRGTLSTEAAEVLSAVPRALAIVRKDPEAQLRKLEAWCEKHGHQPRHDSDEAGSDAEEEVSLGQWMYRHIHRRHDPLETPATQAIRDRILELKSQYPSQSDSLRAEKARRILDFLRDHGRLPNLVHEPELYRDCFIIHQRWQEGQAPVPVINEMLAATHDLPDHLHSQWDARLQMLKDFIAQNGTPPRTGQSQGIPAKESHLGRWAARAREIGDPERIARLDAVLRSGHLAQAA